MNPKKLLALAILGLTLIFSGTNCRKKEKEARPEKPGAVVPEKFTAADLRPSIVVDGIPNRLPRSIKFIFLRSVISPDQVGKDPGKDTLLKITPEIKGDLAWASDYLLEFKPGEPFPFERAILVQLLKVNTSQGVMEPPPGEKWERQFATPEFDFRRVELEDVNFGKAEARLITSWTGPVSRETIKSHCRVSIGETQISNLEFIQKEPEVVLIIVHSNLLGANQKLKIALHPGITSADGKYRLEREISEEYILVEPKHLKILQVSAKEGEQGYYLEVSCQDEAHLQEYWGYDGYAYECALPAESIKDYVQIEPAVKFSVSPVRNGFRIFGEFRRGTYDLSVQSGLHSTYGGILTKTYETSVNIPARTPKAQFVSTGRYLPRSYITSLPIYHTNVSRVEITARQVYESNLVFWLSGENEKADDRTSDIVGKKSFEVKAAEDVRITSWLDLTGLIPENRKGIFELTISGGAQTDSARLILTDLALITKRSGDQGQNFELWAVNVQNLEPGSGVKVDLVTTSNRTIAGCQTDSDGACHFKNIIDPLNQKQPFAVIAQKGDDLIALRFSDLIIPTGDFPVQGPPYHQQSPYQAAIYADRGVYRPGEIAHLVAIIRDENNIAPKADLPVVGRLMDPRKKQVIQLTGKTNQAGLAAFDLPFQAYANTGKYQLVLEIAGNKVAGYDFNVEEFVPERMKVQVSPEKPAYLQSETPAVKISAQYLFGAIASGEKVELSCNLNEDIFKPEKNQTYFYSVWRKDPFKPIALGTVAGQLDDKGSVTLECPAVESQTGFKGPGKLVAMASVFESGSGRTTMNQAAIPIHPDLFYLGLQSSAEKAEPGKAVNVKGIIVDWEGNLLTEERKVRIEVSRLDSEWVWEYDEQEGRENYQRYLQEVPVSQQNLSALNGQFSFSFTPDSAAQGFLVRAKAGDRAETDLQIAGSGYEEEYWEPYVTEIETTPKPLKPESIKIEAPDKIKLGESAKVVVYPPYKGKMLFTVETDQILESRWMKVSAEPMELNFKVDQFYPNVYVSALLLKDPHLESEKAFMPARSFGVKSISIIPEKQMMSLKVSGPAEIKPNQKFTVTLELGKQDGPVFATVAAVDEGILQLTRFKSPDPLALLFQKRALGVDTFETIGWTLMIPPIAQEKSPGGSEAEKGLAGRVQPIKPVALWSGIVEIPESGKAEINFKVPTYRGQLRVMAVAVSPSRIGSADTAILVRDPLVLQTTFPRFLIDNDRFVVPVFLTNMTGKQNTFEVHFTAGDRIKIEDESKKSIPIAPGESGAVTFVARALSSFGAAEFEIEAKGGGVTSNDNARIPFLPAASVTRETTVYHLQVGKNSLADSLKGWEPQYEKTAVWVTGNRYAQELSHLKWLIQYPYGCIEQTTSFTRPLLYIGTLLYNIDPDTMKSAGIEEKFMHGANRLLSMQTSEGGFSFWPGAQAPTYWGTAYAAYTLWLGKEQGYPIPEDRLEDALKFMETALNGDLSRTDAKYGYTVAKSEPLMQYVLALTGRPRKGRIAQLIKSPNSDWGELSEENLFLLKAALYLAGDRSYEKDLKNPSSGKISDARANDWGFWSELRTRGMILDIMEELFPGSKEAEPLAEEIAGRLRAGASYNFTTQELSWCVSGLGKRVTRVATSWSAPKLVMDGKNVPALPKPEKGGADTNWSISSASSAKSLELAVDKIEGGALFALVTVEGIKPGVPFEQGDHSVKVNRRYLYASGDEVMPESVKLGEVIYVELTLSNLTGKEILNLSLVDRFGAGLEIENPRLSRTHLAEWINQERLWNLDYIDIRDDRIALFGHLEPHQEAQAVYVVRAVTAGDFFTPPVRAEAMYEPRVWSQELGRKIRISDPWGALTQ